MNHNLLAHFKYLACILLLSFLIIVPYFRDGFFTTHDGEWAVVRLSDMFRTLRDLQFPARYSGALNFGYGYPLFNFAYPMPYYLGTLIYFLTGSFTSSIKLIFAISVPLSAIFMYFASYELWKDRLSALVSSVLYIYLPYRMVDLYVRGSIGESISFVLFPLIFGLTLKLFNEKNTGFLIVLLSLSFAFLITTHNIMTVLFLPVLFIFTISKSFISKNFLSIKPLLISFFLGVGLSAFFWFPALFEKNNIYLSQIPIADRNIYFVRVDQLLWPNWGYAPPTETGGFSYQIGISQILILIIAFAIFIYLYLKKKFHKKKYLKDALLLLVISFLSIFMMFSISRPIWENTPLLSEINYPWTMLSQTGFLISLLAGFIVIQNRYLKYLALIIIAFSIISTISYAKPSDYVNRSDNFYLTNEATTTSSDELMPIWVKNKPISHFENKVEPFRGDLVFENINYNSNKTSFSYTASDESIVRVNTIYYPGWKAYVNNLETEINYKNDMGVMEVKVPSGMGKVDFIFTETTERQVSNIISVLSGVIILIFLIRIMIVNKK